jgi:hypothetical protein
LEYTASKTEEKLEDITGKPVTYLLSFGLWNKEATKVKKVVTKWHLFFPPRDSTLFIPLDE